MVNTPKRKSKKKNNRLFLIGAVAALVIGGLVYMVRSGGGGSSTGSGVPSSGIINNTNVSQINATISVVVAKSDIPAGVLLTSDNMKILQETQGQAPTGAAQSVTSLTATKEYAKVEIPANAPILQSQIVGDPSQITTGGVGTPTGGTTPTGGGGTTSGSLGLQPGDVALDIPLDTSKGVGGYLQAGNHIDILVDTNGAGNLRWVFQDIPVLEIGQAGSASGSTPAAGAALIVVEATRLEAAEFSYILDRSGSPNAPVMVRYLLRPSSEAGKGPLAAPAITPAQWAALFG